MRRLSKLQVFLFCVIAFFALVLFYKSTTRYECKDDRTTEEIRVSIELRSPLIFWSEQSGKLTVSGMALFFVKRENKTLSLYKNERYAGSFNPDINEVFIDFPDKIFEGSCRII